MKINLKIPKELEENIKVMCKELDIAQEEFILDIVLIGLQTFMLSTKFMRSKFKKGGVSYDNDNSKIA